MTWGVAPLPGPPISNRKKNAYPFIRQVFHLPSLTVNYNIPTSQNQHNDLRFKQ